MTQVLSSSIPIGSCMLLGSFSGKGPSRLSGMGDVRPLRYLGRPSSGMAHGGMPKFPTPLPSSTSLSAFSGAISMKMAHMEEQQSDYRSPLIVRLATILVFLLLSVGILSTIFERNALTAALVPAGFTLWAVLASSLRARGGHSE
jgi:hypothetical protein